MNRITKIQLDCLVERINIKAGAPLTPYTRIDGKYTANIGNYHLNSAYGGHQLAIMCNEGGGIHNITSGFDSKKDLYYQLQAFLSGMDAATKQGV